MQMISVACQPALQNPSYNCASSCSPETGMRMIATRTFTDKSVISFSIISIIPRSSCSVTGAMLWTSAPVVAVHVVISSSCSWWIHCLGRPSCTREWASTTGASWLPRSSSPQAYLPLVGHLWRCWWATLAMIDFQAQRGRGMEKCGKGKDDTCFSFNNVIVTFMI